MENIACWTLKPADAAVVAVPGDNAEATGTLWLKHHD